MDDARHDKIEGLRAALGGHYHIWEMKGNAEERGIADFNTTATIRHPCSETHFVT